MIVHVSGDFNITFKDGYHLFKIIKNNGSSDGKRLYIHHAVQKFDGGKFDKLDESKLHYQKFPSVFCNFNKID